MRSNEIQKHGFLHELFEMIVLLRLLHFVIILERCRPQLGIIYTVT